MRSARAIRVDTISRANRLRVLNKATTKQNTPLQWTGEQAHPTKRGKLAGNGAHSPDQPPEMLWTLAKHPQQWLRQVKGTERHYYRAIGSAEALMAKAKELWQRWMKGISAAKAIR